MLSAEQDVLTVLVEKIHPAATSSTLQRMRDTVDAAIIMPISSAARNAMICLLTYRVLGLPCAHIASFGVVLFTLFPLTYAWVVCVPWVVVWCATGHWLTGLTLLMVMAAALSGRTDSEKKLQVETGIGDYVHAFSLVLGVYVFGMQGVLFGPMLVCIAKLCFDMASDLIQDAEGHYSRSPVAGQTGDSPVASAPAPGAPAGARTGKPPDANGGPGALPAIDDESLEAVRRHLAPAPQAAPPPPAGQTPFPARKADSRDSHQPWSRSAGHVLTTIRRLSFFSSPGAATPHGTAARQRSRSIGHHSDTPAVQRSASLPNGGATVPFGSPPPQRYDAMALSSVAFAVVVSGEAGGAPGAAVRVSAPSTLGSAQLHARVEERLRAAGALPIGHAIRRLHGSDGARVVLAEDVREGETLAAELHLAAPPSQHEDDVAATTPAPAPVQEEEEGDDGEDDSPRSWEHNAVAGEASDGLEVYSLRDLDAPSSAPDKEVMLRSPPLMTPGVARPRQRTRRTTFGSDVKPRAKSVDLT